MILYVDGKPLGEVKDLEEVTPVQESNEPTRVRRIGREVSGKFTCKMDTLTLLSIRMGKKVTNNWLKMHGGILQRKAWKRKHRRKHG